MKEIKPPLSEENSNIQLMSPARESIEVKRKISYVEQDQAFTQIRLGKEELMEFSFLKTKENIYDFFIITKIHRKFEQIRDELDKLEKLGIIPMLSFIGKEKKED